MNEHDKCLLNTSVKLYLTVFSICNSELCFRFIYVTCGDVIDGDHRKVRFAMAHRSRILPRLFSAVILLAMFAVPAAWAEPASRPAVAPVARVDLGAPDRRCPDLAYPLWDDGMCVRAKCVDDDACDFSRLARAEPPAAPGGLAAEPWRTATAAVTRSTKARSAPILLARDRGGRRATGLPLLAEARTLPTQARPASRDRADSAGMRANPGRPAQRPSFWNRLRAAFDRLWRRIGTLSLFVQPRGDVTIARGAP